MTYIKELSLVINISFVSPAGAKSLRLSTTGEVEVTRPSLPMSKIDIALAPKLDTYNLSPSGFKGSQLRDVILLFRPTLFGNMMRHHLKYGFYR